MTYFTLLNLPPAFDLDLAALEAAYFQQQRQYHPDRFAGKPAAERQAALQRSVDINHAYHTLKNPLKRAQYLLHSQGITVGTEADSVKPSPALLMESMELREQAAEADGEALGKMEMTVKEMITQSVNMISSAYTDAQWNAMAQETLRLGYLLKAQEEITQRLKRIA